MQQPNTIRFLLYVYNERANLLFPHDYSIIPQYNLPIITTIELNQIDQIDDNTLFDKFLESNFDRYYFQRNLSYVKTSNNEFSRLKSKPSIDISPVISIHATRKSIKSVLR